MLTSERAERRARRRWRAAAGAEARQVSTGGGTRDIRAFSGGLAYLHVPSTMCTLEKDRWRLPLHGKKRALYALTVLTSSSQSKPTTTSTTLWYDPSNS